MDNRTLTLFSFIIGICIAILFATQYFSLIWNVETEPFLTHNGTRGIALESDGKLWTLSFEEQNAFIDAINRGEEIDKASIGESDSPLPFGKVIVYQFDKPDLHFLPVTIDDGDIYFSAPQILKNGYIREESSGQMVEMLSNAYDS